MEDSNQSTFTRRVGRLFTRKKSLKISGDNPKYAYDMIVSLVTAYEELDKAKSRKKQLLSSKSGRTIGIPILDKTNSNTSQASLSKASYTFVFHLLNQTLGEFYDNYKAYCINFDQDDSYKIEEKEFQEMVDFLCHPDNMGNVKVRKSFEVFSPNDFRMYNKVALINPSSDHQLEPFLKKGMFTVLAIKDTNANEIGSQTFIHYLRFFPLLFSYFTEFIKQRVMLRMKNMEVISGLNSDKKRLETQDPSFLDKLEHLGYNYNGDDQPTRISFTTLEKALILFRNNYSATFGQELIPLIVNEMRIKCKVKDSAEAEEKKIPLTYKLLRWIAYRICLHCSLYTMVKESNSPRKMPQHKVLQEYTIWATAYNEKRFDKLTMQNKFRRYIVKYKIKDPIKDIDSSEAKTVITSLLGKFYRKFTPHISDQSVEKIYQIFCDRYRQLIYEDMLDALAECVYDIMIDAASNKLMEFIETVYKSLKPEKKEKKWKERQANFKSYKSQNNNSEDQKSDDSDKSRNSSLDISASANKNHTPLMKSATSREIKSTANLKTRNGSTKGNILSKLDLGDEESLKKDNNEVAEILGLNSSIHKGDSTLPQGKKVEEFESEVDKVINDALLANEKLDILVEPSLKRRSSITSNLSDNQSEILSKKPSIFSHMDSIKSDKRASSTDLRRQKGAQIDISMISSKPDDGMYLVKSSTIKSKLPDPMEDFQGDKRLVNQHTRRKVDIMNSYFILETFFGKMIEKTNEAESPTRKELKRESSFRSLSNSPLHRSRSSQFSDPKVLNLHLARSSFFKQQTSDPNSPKLNSPKLSKFKAENSPAYSKTKAADSFSAASEEILQNTNSPLLTKLFNKGVGFTHIKQKLRGGLKKIQDRKNARKRDLNPEEELKAFYKVENQEFTEFLKNYDMKETEFIEFKRREEAERKRECELCGTKKCTIF